MALEIQLEWNKLKISVEIMLVKTFLNTIILVSINRSDMEQLGRTKMEAVFKYTLLIYNLQQRLRKKIQRR